MRRSLNIVIVDILISRLVLPRDMNNQFCFSITGDGGGSLDLQI